MKMVPCLLCALILVACATPVAAAAPNQFSYITVTNCSIQLCDDDAVIGLNYSIDPGIEFLVHLLGKSDLKWKLGTIIGYPDARYQTIGMDHATIHVNDASQNYGDGSYWFPAHTFGIEVPEVTIVSPQTSRSYTMAQTVQGMGYFGAKGTK
jgi:hypothetical protein